MFFLSCLERFHIRGLKLLKIEIYLSNFFGSFKIIMASDLKEIFVDMNETKIIEKKSKIYDERNY